MNTTKRKLLTLLSVPLLALPSAIGVFYWLSPHSGWFGAALTAAGFEVLYIGVNVLIISSPELRKYARNVALAAVATAVIFNTLARYQAMLCPPLADGSLPPGCSIRTAPDDPFALFLAVLESIPLAGLAYAVSVLLHRLSEAETRAGDEATRQAAMLASVQQELRQTRDLVASSEHDAASLREVVAGQTETIADLRAQLASKDEAAAPLREELAELRDRLARIEPTAANLGRSLEETRDQLRTAREDVQQLTHEAATLRSRPAPLPPSRTQVIAYARERMDAGASRSEVAAELGYSESTLRTWMEVATNGHTIEPATR